MGHCKATIALTNRHVTLEQTHHDSEHIISLHLMWNKKRYYCKDIIRDHREHVCSPQARRTLGNLVEMTLVTYPAFGTFGWLIETSIKVE